MAGKVVVIDHNEYREPPPDDRRVMWERIKGTVRRYIGETEAPIVLSGHDLDREQLIIGDEFSGSIGFREQNYSSKKIEVTFKHFRDEPHVKDRFIELWAAGAGYENLYGYSLGLAEALAESTGIQVYAHVRKPTPLLQRLFHGLRSHE